MGMVYVWDKERGMGERSWRYSMVVNDGVVEKIFSEVCSFVFDAAPL
jgi:peroxiredoxin